MLPRAVHEPERIELLDKPPDVAFGHSPVGRACQLVGDLRRRAGAIGTHEHVIRQLGQLKESIVCNAELWAACIGGAAQQDAYRHAIEAAGFAIEEIKENPYRFISERAVDASAKYGVKSVSIRARKP